MTDVETLIAGLGIQGGAVGDMERELLQRILDGYEMRLSRIEKALGIEPLSEDEKKENAQVRWFSASEPWREEIRKARSGE